ncbi:MAG: class IIb bacteriocin, lactobin A/cerein 7B family [Spirosomaceae bacterium]|jgi:hypothetical protein|nr:class IIb bacteriocin, lactobin A/cerein 7B family [Spirosomataceae bacterium]
MEKVQTQEMYAQVVQAAWEDAQFKKDLVANPVDAIEQLTGLRIELPQGQTLVVADQTDESKVYLTIPRKVEIDNVELNEEQLEAVSGGALPYVVLSYAGAFWTACAAAGTAVGTAVASYMNRQDAAAAPKTH